MPLRPGDVVVLFDATTRPPKTKRFLCVVAADGWLLRINTKSVWRPHCLLPAAPNPACLDHDSYLELRGIIDMDMERLEQDLMSGAARVLGRLAAPTLAGVCVAVEAAVTLSPVEKQRILAALQL